jgi:hypothetical protein
MKMSIFTYKNKARQPGPGILSQGSPGKWGEGLRKLQEGLGNLQNLLRKFEE